MPETRGTRIVVLTPKGEKRGVGFLCCWLIGDFITLPVEYVAGQIIQNTLFFLLYFIFPWHAVKSQKQHPSLGEQELLRRGRHRTGAVAPLGITKWDLNLELSHKWAVLHGTFKLLWVYPLHPITQQISWLHSRTASNTGGSWHQPNILDFEPRFFLILLRFGVPEEPAYKGEHTKISSLYSLRYIEDTTNKKKNSKAAHDWQ